MKKFSILPATNVSLFALMTLFVVAHGADGPPVSADCSIPSWSLVRFLCIGIEKSKQELLSHSQNQDAVTLL
jgi:hypothetical protein